MQEMKLEIWISNDCSKWMNSSESTEQTDMLTSNKLLWRFSNKLGKVKFSSYLAKALCSEVHWLFLFKADVPWIQTWKKIEKEYKDYLLFNW